MPETLEQLDELVVSLVATEQRGRKRAAVMKPSLARKLNRRVTDAEG